MDMVDRMNEVLVRDIEDVYSIIDEFYNNRERQKNRGLNDFNLFTTLLNKSDEVRLHSRFIASLLAPNGKHGQGELFIDIFLRTIGLSDFNIDTSKCVVYKEYRNIDIYITDGDKHIIIENKVYAGDQEKQIERYIKEIISADSVQKHGELAVVYLSLNGKNPSTESLGEVSILNGFLRLDEVDHIYRPISYDDQIMSWINKSVDQVCNITNLNVVLSQYKDVISKVYGKYEGNLMMFDEYIKSSVDVDEIEVVKKMSVISSKFTDIRKKIIYDFFENVRRRLVLPDGYHFHLENVDKLSKAWGFHLTVYKNESDYILYGLEFDKSDYHDMWHGIVRRSKKINIKDDLLSDDEVCDALNQVINPLKKQTVWWIGTEQYQQGDILNFILDNGGVERASQKLSERISEIVHSYQDVMEVSNKHISSKI